MGLHQGTAAGAHRNPIGYNLVFSDILDLFLSEGLHCSGHLHLSLFPLSYIFASSTSTTTLALQATITIPKLGWLTPLLACIFLPWFFRISVVGDSLCFFQFRFGIAHAGHVFGSPFF
jgi:hypothetical protein